MSENHVTLGRSVVPERYTLELEPNLKTFRFKGKVTIKAHAKAGTKAIRLNAKDLRIEGARVKAGNAEQRATVTMNKKQQEITLKLQKPVAGEISIMIRYQGANTDSLDGFYRSSYTYKKKKGYILVTQFEPADARKALPCFDEPEFKAVYDVSLTIDKDLDAISNTEIKEASTAKNGKKTVTFHTSPKMSSYLLFLAVGKFEYLKGRYRNVTVRVVTTPGKIQYGKFALGVGKNSLQFYERYFGIRYPLKKLDLIAAPDFAVGAMENWGAILFRETELLCDSDNASKVSRQHISETIAHEIAHQWFGDLVTMKWWDDTWLNESFASIMAFRALDSIYPKWKIMEQFPLDSREGTDLAMSADQLKDTHPISMPVRGVENIEDSFDRISYAKGSNVLVMLEDYVGPDVYRDGLHLYLKKHAYSNATKSDLWTAIDAAARHKRRRVKALEVARAWVEREGYPIVSAYRTEHVLHVSQSRYTLTERKAAGRETWPVPVKYTADTGAQGSLLLQSTDHDVKIEGTRWVKLNYGQRGFYRVKYVDDLLDELGNAILSGKINGVDAWGIENDLFALVRSGRLRMRKYLKFVFRYCMDVKYPANMSISEHLGWLHTMGYNQRYLGWVDKISHEYHVGMLKKLGWRRNKSESTIDSMLRARAIAALVRLDHKPTAKRLAEMFKAFNKKRNAVDPDLISVMFASTAWNGKGREYKKLAKMYEKEEVPEIKMRLLASLGYFRDQKLVSRVLEYSRSSKVRLQNSYAIPMIVSANPANNAIMLKWTMKNWSRFMKLYTPGTKMLSGFVKELAINNDSASKAAFAKFFGNSKNRRPDLERPIRQTLEIIDANIRFVGKNTDK